jgi:hypothetical protein
MRLSPILLLLLLAAPASAIGRPQPPASAAALLRFHPGPWRLPETFFAMREEPAGGESVELPAQAARGATVAALRRAAETSVRRNADGSRHAVLGSAFRSWTVARITEDGRLVQECVDDLDAANARVRAESEAPR